MEHNNSIRPATKRLVGNLTLDLPMDPPLMTDFGIDSDDHYRALRAVLFNEDHAETPEAAAGAAKKRMRFLDDAHGNGPRLNALVKLYAPEYADRVTFQTSWDVIYGRTGDEAERLQQEAEQKYRGNMPERNSAPEPQPDAPNQQTFDEQDDGRWDHHHPDDLAMLKRIQNDLREMKADQLADQLADSHTPEPQALHRPDGQGDGRESLFVTEAQPQKDTGDVLEKFFGRSAKEQQQKPPPAREPDDGIER